MMWRAWLLAGQSLGFALALTAAVAVWEPGAARDLGSAFVGSLVLSGLVHLLGLEVFSYPEAWGADIEEYARECGPWRPVRIGLVCGAGGVLAGLAVYAALGGLFPGWGWLGLACPVFALVVAVAWACRVPPRERPTPWFRRFPGADGAAP